MQELIGQRFGKLIVIKILPEKNKYGITMLECYCDCGKKRIVRKDSLITGNTKSCGCLNTMKGKGFIDLSGKRFGNITVISENKREEYFNSGRIFPKIYWNCTCDCGNHCIVDGQSLRNGHTKSCGCYGKKQRFDSRYRGDGIAALNELYYAYKRNAKTRKLNFQISMESFIAITSMTCYYCGLPPSMIQKGAVTDYTYNGIDRVDSNKGYTEDNVVPCCKNCNKAKMAMSRENFLSWVERVYNHSIKGK